MKKIKQAFEHNNKIILLLAIVFCLLLIIFSYQKPEKKDNIIIDNNIIFDTIIDDTYSGNYKIDELNQIEMREYIIWMLSDVHIGCEREKWNIGPNYQILGPQPNQEDFWNAINYSNSLNQNRGVDIAFAIGDNIHDNYGASYNHWTEFHTLYNYLHCIYKNYTLGNHDADWKEYSWLRNTADKYPTGDGTYFGGNYTYEFGNLLFIIMSPEITGEDNRDLYSSRDRCGGFCREVQRNWINQTVQKYGKTHNIFLLMHQYPYNSLPGWDANPGVYFADENTFFDKDRTSDQFNKMIYWLNTNGFPVVSMFVGHTHQTITFNKSFHPQMFQKYRGTYIVNCGGFRAWIATSCLYGNGSFSSYLTPFYSINEYICASENPAWLHYRADSRYLYLTPGSNEMIIKSVNHTANKQTIEQVYSIPLTYPFSPIAVKAN